MAARLGLLTTLRFSLGLKLKLGGRDGKTAREVRELRSLHEKYEHGERASHGKVDSRFPSQPKP